MLPATAPKLTTRADCALTSVCRLVAMVNRRSAQPAVTDQTQIDGNKWYSLEIHRSLTMTDVQNGQKDNLGSW